MPSFIVSEAVATAIFTVTRLLYGSLIGIIALILFSKLPGGSSAKFWYEQPDIVAKVASLFHPFGSTGKRGVKSTNFIAMLCTIAALALNILPTFLSKLSPITSQVTSSVVNSTLSPISNIFIPTLTDINLPGLSNLSTSKLATNKFLCSHIASGCVDSQNKDIAKINWDIALNRSIDFSHPDAPTPNSFTVTLNDSFATSSTPQLYMFIAKNVFNSTSPFQGTSSTGQWLNNNLTGFYVDTLYGDSAASVVPYDLLHSDQFSPLQTPDIADLLRQGRNKTAPMPSGGSIDRAERWVALHRTETLSSLLWQTVNAHEGQVGDNWQSTCFLCSLLDLKRGSAQVINIQNSLISASTTNSLTYAVHSYVDRNYRLATMVCLLQLNNETQGLSYHCLHTFSQLWSISHLQNPYKISGKYNDFKTASDLGDYGTAFPIFPPPTNLTTDRTYFPIVPIFQIRSKGQCATDWNPQVESIQTWINTCATANLGQVDPASLDLIALNIWQLSSTITVGGFLINATYLTYDVGIMIDTPVIVIVIASIGLCIIGNLVLTFVTSPIQRTSLYEAIRIMVPDSRDPYNVQKMLLNIAPTNTLRLVNSIYDKRVSYLKLNNRLLVAMSEDQGLTDSTTVERVNTDSPNQQEIQKWSRRQLLNF